MLIEIITRIVPNKDERMAADAITQIFKELISTERRKIFIGLMVFGAYALLLLPEPIAKFFHLQTFISTYGQWIGLTALLGTVLVIVWLGILGWSRWEANQCKKQEQQKREAILHNLSPDERDILREFVGSGTTGPSSTCTFDFRSTSTVGIIKGLEKKGILYIATEDKSSSPRHHYGAVNIEQWAYDRLLKCPDLVSSK